jgi:hypothetical protein
MVALMLDLNGGLNGGRPPVTTGLEHLLNPQVISLNGGP